MQLKLRINNQTYEVDTPAEMPLLWVLRDKLDLTGTKYGCGMAQCGACTVLMNGNAVRSCVLPVASVQNQRITTIEGIATDGKLHPLQEAWIEANVPQCGYCQAGQIMSAVALLQNNAKPSEAEIKTAMAGNICRCGTYQRICQAIQQAAEAMD
ncbi:MAG: (2Fe-2S)-binding protein [Saprospiraceae bacterium]